MQQFHLIIFFIFSFVISLVRLEAQNITLNIVGIDSIETKIINDLSYNKLFKDYKSLQKEINSIGDNLQINGFIESRLLETKKIHDSLFQAIFTLKQSFDTIYIYYNKKDVKKDVIQTISSNFNDTFFTLPVSKIGTSLNYLNSELTNNGDPFIRFNLKNIIKKGGGNLKADLVITRESKRMIDNIIVKGYREFPKSYIKYFLKIRKQQLFNLKKITQKTKQINDLAFSNQIKYPEVLFTKDSTTVFLYLQKTKSNTFDGFLGFGTNEASSKVEFDGYLNLNLVNNLNYGEQFKLLYKSDENNQKTFDANLNLPYVFGLPVGAELALNIFKKDSTFTTINQNLSVFYQVNTQHQILAGINTVVSNDILNDNTLVNLNDYSTTFYKIRYRYKQSNDNNFLFPIKLKIQSSFGVGLRKTTNGEEKQQSLNFKISKIFNIDNSNSFYVNVNTKVLASDNYLTNELYRFGGINSIRGFEENSIEASQFGLINIEYRYRLSSGIYAHTISDIAYFENKIINLKEKLFGFGFGFGVITKAGLFKLNYANGKNTQEKFKFANSKIHLSLNAIF